ncbi:thiamine pyrophosphokinase [Histomonas meleagridis]|uniref:thiamine pyrophosphokinase n=1 Tax=Histomonas meleagridis TaxID=135588 RepID=UPI00355AB26E|nr:thiamine pyrophosphokinase [Histomonas meleagridis]KAH0797300.1 thiamine pyrophosphokinase [Histomonas meleagridis]
MISNPLETGEPYIALALNYYLPKFFDKLWSNAKMKICADGGANRLVNYFKEKKMDLINPTLVVGDLDSVHPEVEEKLKAAGTKFLKFFDQDYNDIEKSIRVISMMKLKEPILVFGGLGGRLDQTIATFHTGLAHPEHKIFFIDDSNVATWVRPNDKGIICNQKWTTPICGILPIARPIRNLKTKGLKWDIHFPLEMGKFISSSNEIAKGASKIEIETSDPFLWTNQMKDIQKLPL